MTDRMSVLHIGDELNWRGAENQLRFLVQNSSSDISHHIAYPKKSRAYSEFQNIVPTLALPQRRGIRNVLRLIHYCKKNKIEILNAHSASAHRQALMVKRFLPGIKLIVHRRVNIKIKNNIFSRSKYMSKKVDHFVAISQHIKETLLNYGLDKNKISVIPSAVDATKYEVFDKKAIRRELAKELDLNDELVWIGNASAFTKEKGYENLIEALRLLKLKGVSFQALLAGDGPLLDSIKNKVKILGLENEVRFLGFTSSVETFLSALDVLAFPTKNEGLGTLVQDASYAGCAVAATNVGGVPEMILDNKTGLLSDIEDIEALSNNLEKLIKDSNLRQKLNENAVSWLKENFSLKNMVEKNLNLYRKIIRD